MAWGTPQGPQRAPRDPPGPPLALPMPQNSIETNGFSMVSRAARTPLNSLMASPQDPPSDPKVPPRAPPRYPKDPQPPSGTPLGPPRAPRDLPAPP